MKLSDFLNSINYNKESLLDNDEKAEKLYLPFLVNKNFSFFVDTIFHANEMNCKWELDKKMQFDFLRFTVRKRKRYCSWIKKHTEDDVALVKEVYGYTDAKAIEALNILGPKDLELLKKSLYKGGNNNKG